MHGFQRATERGYSYFLAVLVQTGIGEPESSLLVNQSFVSLGRQESNHVVINNRGVSSLHGELTLDHPTGIWTYRQVSKTSPEFSAFIEGEWKSRTAPLVIPGGCLQYLLLGGAMIMVGSTVARSREDLEVHALLQNLRRYRPRV